MEKDINENIGFKLISLDLRDTTLMGKSKLLYNFLESKNQKSIYTTVIIGANGTGKSNLFRIIIELFKELEDLSKGKARSYPVDGRFNLKFSIYGDIYEYANMYDEGNLKGIQDISEKASVVHLIKNGEKENFDKVQLPIAIVANSIMLTDKYPFFKKETLEDGEKIESFPRYKYLGVRNIAQNASTRAYVRKTVEFIVQEFNSVAFRKGLQRATNFLGLTNSIDIYYYTSNNAKFFRGKLTPQILAEYYAAIRKKYPNSDDNPPFKLNQYEKIMDDPKLIGEICKFCDDLVTENLLVRPNYKYSSIRKIVYNLIDQNSFEKLNKDFSMLEHLRQLGIISAPEIELKRADGYSLQESSSGEYHFFSSIVGLMATVKTNSLVFIDEPEISLHPNWQMKYLSFIRELFASEEYATSHILIATHSHFLISDLKAESSKIIGLKREDGKIKIVEDLSLESNTFGWSAEQILLEIFQVSTTRNYYIAEKVGDILEMVSKSERDENEIRAKVKELVDSNIISLSKEDPLKPVIDRLIQKYG